MTKSYEAWLTLTPDGKLAVDTTKKEAVNQAMGILKNALEDLINKEKDIEVEISGSNIEKDPNDIYLEVIAWLYENDGAFDSRQEWREAFLQFLRKVL